MKKNIRDIINKMLKAQSDAEWNEITHKIDFAFQHEQITWADNELLYGLVNRLWVR